MTCMRSDSISLIYSICRLDRVGCAVPCRLLSWGENWFNISKYLSFAINKKEIFRYRSCLYQQIGNNLWCAKTKKGLRIKIIMTANQFWYVRMNEWKLPISTGEWRIYLHIKMHVLTTKQCCDLLNWVSIIHNTVICMNDSNYAWRE